MKGSPGAILAGVWQEVGAAGRPSHYQGREGWFSWFTVKRQDSDVINLFSTWMKTICQLTIYQLKRRQVK